MSRHERRLLLVFGLLLLWAPSGAALAQDAASPTVALSDEEKERFLREARIERTEQIGKGVTNALRATLSDGTLTHDAQIQTIDVRRDSGPSRQGIELNFRDSWAFNVAAYKLDRLIGLGLVPVSVERRYRSKSGAFTWWIDDVLMDEGARFKKKIEPPNPRAFNEIMSMVRLFDQLIYNVDRNMGNILYTKDWRVWAIDHTRAFRLHRELRAPENITRCDRRVFEALKRLDKETLEREIGRYLTGWEIDAILARRDAIVKIIEERGPSALFDRQDS